MYILFVGPKSECPSASDIAFKSTPSLYSILSNVCLKSCNLILGKLFLSKNFLNWSEIEFILYRLPSSCVYRYP